MKKYFFISDIHSDFNAFVEALNRNGFQEDNPDHILVGCGDYFDRGYQPVEMANYILEHQDDRHIWLMGNHDQALLEMAQRGYAMQHDIHNYTTETAASLLGLKELTLLKFEEIFMKDLRIHPIMEVIKKMPYYLQGKTFFATHAWITTNINQWGDALWSNSYNKAYLLLSDLASSKKNFMQVVGNKTLIIGHWHATGFKDLDPSGMTSEGYFKSTLNGCKLVAIDGCSCITHHCPVYTVEED